MSKILEKIENPKKITKGTSNIKEGSGRQKRIKKMGLAGRPILDIDEEALYKLAQTLLPVDSIATIMNCSKDLIETRYAGVLQRGRENRKHSLSEAMWSKALYEKDTKMMIWLSKQHLGYKDVIVEESTQIVFNIQTNEVPE